ncbi:MAG: hypothetical protein ABR936_07550 [Bacteroidota bacterium]
MKKILLLFVLFTLISASTMTYSSNKRVTLEINPEYRWVKHVLLKKVIAFNDY